jgi:hypothetical protein
MTDEPPPWARPRPDADPSQPSPAQPSPAQPSPAHPGPVQPASGGPGVGPAPRPVTPGHEAAPGDRPLFGAAPDDDPPLFAGLTAPARVREKIPDLPPDVPRRQAGVFATPVPSPAAPPAGRRPPPMPAPAPVPPPPAVALPDPEVGLVSGPVVVSVVPRTFPNRLARLVRRPGSVTVRRFTVRPATGPSTTYVLEGDLPADALRTGDLVRVVRGRRRHDGDPVARTVQILATLNGPVVRQLP